MSPNIILIGFMGSGKSSVTHALSALSGYDYIDTDKIIETQEALTISEIFSQKGETYFRQGEHRFCQTLSSYHNTIIATGGGLSCQKENQDLLKKSGFIVYLKASQETINARLKNDTSRPLFTQPDLLAKRDPIYQQLADLEIETQDLSVQNIAEAIWNTYTKKYA
ncbi:MAG: shikimate kinase [Candidatus Margulisbacteria bacterium]|nr:shikimate kinase [Candidatus Margulisiibacteriota bacterium]